MRRLRKFYQTTGRLGVAAAKAGMSERTARDYLRSDKLPSEARQDARRDRSRSLDDQRLKSHALARLDAYRQVVAYERQLFSTVTSAVDSMLAGVRGLEGDVEMMLVEAELAAPLYEESARGLFLSDRVEGVLQQLSNANYYVVYRALDESIEALRQALEDYQHRLNNEFLPKLRVAPSAT